MYLPHTWLCLIRDGRQSFLSLTSFFHTLSLHRSTSNSLETTHDCHVVLLVFGTLRFRLGTLDKPSFLPLEDIAIFVRFRIVLNSEPLEAWVKLYRDGNQSCRLLVE